MPVLSRNEIASFLQEKISVSKIAQSGPRKRKLVSFHISVGGTVYRVDYKPGTRKRPHWVRLYQEVQGEEYKVTEGEADVTKDNSDIEALARNLSKAILLDLPGDTISPDAEETAEMNEKRTTKNKDDVSDAAEATATTAKSPLVAVLPIAAIKSRVGPDTRRINIAHMVHLAESIAVLGILQPLVVDQSHHLLAGGHRLASLHLLAITDPEERVTHVIGTYGELPGRIKAELEERIRALEIQPDAGDLSVAPVHVLGFDSKQEPDIALEVESSENALRHDYSPEEVKGIYDRLVAAGYTDRRGKPREGERAARPAIATIIGKSLRTVRRMLNKEAEVAPTAQNRTSAGLALVEGLERRLTKSLKDLQAWAEEDGETPEEVDALLAKLQTKSLADRILTTKKCLGWTDPEAPSHEDIDKWQKKLGLTSLSTDRRANRWKRLRVLILKAITQLDLDIQVEGIKDEDFRDGGSKVINAVIAAARAKKREEAKE